MSERMAREQLTGRHVLITGASSGIGRASAAAIARHGATVILLARRADELQSVVQEIQAAGGVAHGYRCDVTQTAEVNEVVAAILRDHGHVDMLINNAGRSIRRSVYRATDRFHDYERTMAVNYFGAVALILALLPQMRGRKFGHIVNISSEGVQVSAPRYSAYLASKAALDKFSEVAAAETLADHITFTTVHMPLVDTPMITPSGSANPAAPHSPEWAASVVLRAVVERPKRIDMPLGTLAEYGALVAPRIKDQVMHQVYRRFGESAAAKGEPWSAPEPSDDAAQRPDDAPDTGAQPRPELLGVRRTLRRIARYVPGTSW